MSRNGRNGNRQGGRQRNDGHPTRHGPGRPQRPAPWWRERVTLGCLTAGTAGALALGASAALARSGLWHRVGLFAFFCVELAILQIIPVRLAHDDEGEDLALDEAFFVPMAMLLTPFETILALGVSIAAGQVFKRSPPLKAVFNVGQALVSAAVGLVVFRAVRAGAPGGSPRTIAAAAAGGLAYAVASSLAVAGIIAVVRRQPLRLTLFRGAGLRAATWGGSISFGIMVFLAITRSAWAVLITVAPIVALQAGYSSASGQRRERRRAEDLFAASTSVRLGNDVADILERFRSASVCLLEAQTAALGHPATVAAAGALRTSVGTDLVLDVVRARGQRAWTDRDRQLAGTLAEVAATTVEKVRLFEEIKRQTLFDALTGLPNQVLFEDRVTHTISQAGRNGSRAAIAYLDLDTFKRINDSLGHAAGNEVLKAAALRLSQATRASDTVARMSGDEFVLLLPTVRSPDDAAGVGQKLVDAFREPFHVAGQRVFCTASVGIALYPDHATQYGSLLQKSDLALYEAKIRGRGTWRLYTTSMSALTDARVSLEADLRAALEGDEFRLMYQPQIDLTTGVVVGAEALVRWQHPTQGLLTPGRFIPLAEDLGLIRLIDRWVLRTACEKAQAWRSTGFPALRIAINLSGAELGAHGLAASILATIDAHEVPASQLELEVTESVAVQDGPATRLVLQELRDHGVGVAIDDFGTGHSTLARLGTFPIDVLKIDKSFIDPIGGASPEAPMVLAIIAMAHSLNLQVVAEGVENVEQLSFLRANGCDRAQGYFVGRPVPAAELEVLVLESSGAG
jgi:diguanylate cyclase (GGDEF)-like protein